MAEDGHRPAGESTGRSLRLCTAHTSVWDNDPVNLILQGLKASIADGWGGSMVATEISDILFGTPAPVRSEANLGVAQGGPCQHRGSRA